MTINVGRRCALPGCYVVIEPEPDGRPRRKYCTPAHRAVARQMRREGVHRSATAPPLPLPLPQSSLSSPPTLSSPLSPSSLSSSSSSSLSLSLPAQAPPEAMPAGRTRRRDSTLAAVRRCRVAAMLGSASLLVPGSGPVTADSPADNPSTLSAPPWNPEDSVTASRWVTQAQLALASLDSQIAQLDRVRQTWLALPPARTAGPLPEPVRQLDRHHTVLVGQRTALRNDVDTYRRLKAETYWAHHQQRQPRPDQREARRSELASLRDNMRKAVTGPLPSTEDRTRVVTEQVNALITHPRPDHPFQESDPRNTPPRGLVTTAAPEPDDPAPPPTPAPRLTPEPQPAPALVPARNRNRTPARATPNNHPPGRVDLGGCPESRAGAPHGQTGKPPVSRPRVPPHRTGPSLVPTRPAPTVPGHPLESPTQPLNPAATVTPVPGRPAALKPAGGRRRGTRPPADQQDGDRLDHADLRESVLRDYGANSSAARTPGRAPESNRALTDWSDHPVPFSAKGGPVAGREGYDFDADSITAHFSGGNGD